MREHAILKGHEVVEVDLMTWAKWYEKAEENDSRRVAETAVRGVRISTVFLGLDHRCSLRRWCLAELTTESRTDIRRGKRLNKGTRQWWKG